MRLHHRWPPNVLDQDGFKCAVKELLHQMPIWTFGLLLLLANGVTFGWPCRLVFRPGVPLFLTRTVLGFLFLCVLLSQDCLWALLQRHYLSAKRAKGKDLFASSVTVDLWLDEALVQHSFLLFFVC